MPITSYLINKWLSGLSTTPLWAALHYDNPATTDAYTSEVFGGSYSRIRVHLGVPSNGAVSVNEGPNFTGMPATSITHLGIWDAQYNGNLLAWGSFPKTIVVTGGKNVPIPAGSIVVSLI